MMLYGKYIILQLKSQLQYKSSFYMTIVTQFIQPFASLAGIYFLFERFGNIDGWGVYEVFLCYSIIGTCFSLSTCFARGFDCFPNLVKNAGFDRILVRPRGTVLQVLGSNFDTKRVGHLLQSIVVLVIAVVGVDVYWDMVKVVTLFSMIVGGSLIFTGVYMLQATAAFWTVEGLEAANVLTHGAKEYASYPLSIFPKWVTTFFTFVIPFGTVNYLPIQFLLGRVEGHALFFMMIPLLGALFILPCILFWKYGVSQYCSTGS